MNPYDARVGLGTAMKAAAWDEGYEAGAAAKQAEIVKLLREEHEDDMLHWPGVVASFDGCRSAAAALRHVADLIERGGE